MQYRRKPKTITAKPYEIGDESGFLNQYVTSPVAMAWYVEKHGKHPLNEHTVVSVPFLRGASADMLIWPGAYIVGEGRSRYPITKEDFEDSYEPVDAKPRRRGVSSAKA